MYTVDGSGPGDISVFLREPAAFLFGVIPDLSGTSEIMEGRLGKSGLGIGATAPKQAGS